MSKQRTITLTDAPPVRIREDDWPVIAHGQYRDYDGQYDFQSDREWKCDIRVRRNTDGRMIVYGTYSHYTAFQRERGITARAGVVLEAGADPIPAIRSIGETLTDVTAEAGFEFNAHVSACVRDCIGDLPANEL